MLLKTKPVTISLELLFYNNNIKKHTFYLCCNANPAFIKSTNSQLVSFTEFPQNITFWYLLQKQKLMKNEKLMTTKFKCSYHHHI